MNNIIEELQKQVDNYQVTGQEITKLINIINTNQIETQKE